MMLETVAEAALRAFGLIAVFWLLLAALRIRDSRVQSAAWRAALVASLLMPLLMQVVVIPIGTVDPHSALLALPVVKAAPVEAAAVGATAPAAPVALSWLAVAWWIYLAVAAFFVLRLVMGLVLTWRMTRTAEPIREAWTNGLDARTSTATSVPVTFGSTVLLPKDYVDWPDDKRRAVVIHERSHVENGDFYIQILTSLNRGVFWFNPAAWWLHGKLTALAENISDDAALEQIADRPNYAEVLLDISSSLTKTPAGVAMARPATVKARIDRILASTTLTSRLNWGKRVVLSALVVPLVALASMSVTATAQTEPKAVSVSPAQLESYQGYYRFEAGTPPAGMVLTVKRDGDHLTAQLTGQPSIEIFPSAPNEFFYKVVRASITFQSDAQGHVTGLVLHQHGMNMKAVRTTKDAAVQEDTKAEQKLAAQRQPHKVVAIDPKLLGFYVGRYQFAPDAILTVTREGNHLYAQLTGQSKFEVYPYGPKNFFYTVVAAQLTFVTDAKGHATAVILHQNGRDQTAPRID